MDNHFVFKRQKALWQILWNTCKSGQSTINYMHCRGWYILNNESCFLLLQLLIPKDRNRGCTICEPARQMYEASENTRGTNCPVLFAVRSRAGTISINKRRVFSSIILNCCHPQSPFGLLLSATSWLSASVTSSGMSEVPSSSLGRLL